MTRASMAPAMGTITVSDRLCSILKMPLFHACGVRPTSAAISPTLAFTVSNSPDRLPVIPSMRMPFIHSSMISLSRVAPPFPRPPGLAGRTRRRLVKGLDRDKGRDQPSSPDSRGTRVTPIRATPPPATSCFMSFMRKYWLEISLEKIKID